MSYRDMLGKRSPRSKYEQPPEDIQIKHLAWPITYSQAREEAHMVIADEGACEVSRGLAMAVIALLDERKTR